MPMISCPTELIALANRLADESGAVIKTYFRSTFAVEGKPDLSPVTVADRNTEKAMRIVLSQERPLDGIIGEEHGNEREDAAFVWVLDPIDGTKAFVAGKPLFGTLIALLHEGEPILGIIDQPILGERWVGAVGHETLFNGHSCHTRSCAKLADAVANLGPQAFPFGNAVSMDAYRRVAKHVKTTSVGGDCYTYGLVASGHIDFALEHNLKIYDFAALVPVVEGAGGVMTDWQGNRLNRGSQGQIMAMGDRRLLDQAVDLLVGVL